MLTGKQVCDRFAVSRQAVRYWVRMGWLHPVGPCDARSAFRFDEAEIATFTPPGQGKPYAA